jgi:hypothetical protein
VIWKFSAFAIFAAGEAASLADFGEDELYDQSDGGTVEDAAEVRERGLHFLAASAR